MITTNRDRAEFARSAVLAFRDEVGGSKRENGSPDYGESIGDLICDLMHLCDAEGEEPFSVLKNAIGHYVCERLDPPDGMAHTVEANVYAIAKPYGSRSSKSFEPYEWTRPSEAELDREEAEEEGEVIEPEDQSQGDVLGLDDEREQP